MAHPKPQRFYFTFYSDWDSLIFWQPMNWRDFTFIHFSIEVNPYRYIDIDLALLGFKFNFAIYKKYETKNDTSTF